MNVKGTQVLVEFADSDSMLQALELLRRHRYRKLETYTPHPIGGVSERLRLPHPWLPKITFAGGLLGALLGYGIQWYADTYDYPLNVGGRPLHSAVAYIPATFEAAVLGAALTAFVVLLFVIGLPALWHPVFEVDRFERATADRYWVSIKGVRDPIEIRKIRHLLAELTPVRLTVAEADP
ncbi:MAG TPA: DUF3341 domain-containing protein [Gemmatimonadales bacterium]|jgi:hypothetical protein